MKLSYFYMMCVFMLIDCCLLIGTLIYKNKKAAKSLAMVITLILISQAFYAASLVITNTEIKFVVHELKFLGIAFFSTGFAIMYMDLLDMSVKRRIKILLMIVPAIAVVLAVTNDYHHLFRISLSVIENEYGSFIGVQSGILFWVYIIYVYLVYLVGIALVVRFYFKTPAIYRMQIGIMIFAAISTLSINFISISGLFFEDFGDLTLISFSFAAVIQFQGLILYKPTRMIKMARSMAVNEIKDPMIIFDYENRFLDANIAAKELFTFEENEELKNFLADKLNMPGNTDIECRELDKNNPEPELYVSLNNSDYTLSMKKITDADGVLSGTVVLLADMTELKRRERKLENLANQDFLTGIPNRHSFLREISKIQDADLPVAVIHFNISGMGAINDKYGNDYGDEIIKQVAGILSEAAKKLGFCAILGGDEFALVLKNSAEADAVRVITEIKEQLPEITLIHGMAVKRSSMDNIQIIVKSSMENLHMNKVLKHSLWSENKC